VGGEGGWAELSEREMGIVNAAITKEQQQQQL